MRDGLAGSAYVEASTTRASEKWLMKKGIRYSDEPIEFQVIDDFLPPPERLALKEENVKVTITLSKDSVDFFKRVVAKRRVPYQKMIRRVLDYYVARYKSA
jgi:predicted DNA binding CopG/RHH family protein